MFLLKIERTIRLEFYIFNIYFQDVRALIRSPPSWNINTSNQNLVNN